MQPPLLLVQQQFRLLQLRLVLVQQQAPLVKKQIANRLSQKALDFYHNLPRAC
ncbi:hypothetical protein [uncultured Nostoc sp.]|uniref:hypothetical protein n=1 Tax=uncultured Nostoc sp. TaxID=340711 RepID=UPI0035C9FC3F